MLLPGNSTDLIERVKELKEQCFASQKARANNYGIWRSYLWTGSQDAGQPALLNKCGPHADRLHSYLYSPAECRFMLEFGQRADKAWHKRELALARHLSKEFHASAVDMAFGDAVFWSIPYGASFVKLGIKTTLEDTPQADTTWMRSLWRSRKRRPSKGILPDEKRQVFDSFDPYVVMPGTMGVFNETVNGLDRQECIVQQTPVTRYELARRLRYHPNGVEIMKKVGTSLTQRTDEETQDFLHQVIIGAQTPLGSGTGTSTGQSQVQIFLRSPSAELSADVAKDMVMLNELWIIDDERGDYTTIQYVEPDILIEGQDIRRNLFIPGHHPFTLVQPNEVQGNFWGRSEFADLIGLQDAIADRLADIMKITALEAAPPKFGSGFTGNLAEVQRAMRTRNGLFVADMPNAKLESQAPKLPDSAYQNLDTLIRYFDQIAGFEPTLMGQGEQGVRAGIHASTLQRAAGSRIRDRALIVERQCAELGSLCFDVMAAKDPTQYDMDGEVILADVPDDHGITIDAHSSSPAFTEDAKSLAFALNKAQAVTPKGLLMLTQPPMVDQLMTMLEEAEKQKAEFLKEHPEALKGGKKKR